MRRAAGPADDGEAFQAQRVGDRPDVLDDIHHPASRQAVGTAVPRTVVGDQLHVAVVEDHAAWSGPEPAAGHSVEEEDRSAVRIPLTLDHQMPSVRHPHPTAHPDSSVR